MADAIRIDSTKFVCELGSDAQPAVVVQPGSVLAIHCRSAADRAVGQGPVRAEGPNPATGPIAVAAARPGQALRVEVLDVVPETPGHVSASRDGGNQAVEIRGGRAIFHGLEVAIAPMIGVLGVAPASGAWNTMDSGPFGGNMDTNDVAPGATVWLPVYQPGGLLVVGDVHAVMGDGEIGGQGLEAAATVTLRLDIEREPLSDHVVIVRGGRTMTVGTGLTVEAAVRDAADAMVAILQRAGRLDAFHAMKFLGLAGQTLFGQHCCRVKTVRVAMAMEYLEAQRREG